MFATIPRKRGVNFRVDSVSPERTPLWNITLAEMLPLKLDRKILITPTPDILVITGGYTAKKPLRRRLFEKPGLPRVPASENVYVPQTGFHPLAEAVQTAFSLHYPLTLSPDAIWLAIAQGFSHHITQFAEAYRGRLVQHEGKRVLSESVCDLSMASFEHAIAGFSAQIRDASDLVLHETLVCDFSTTTPAIRTASEVVLMDTYSRYFSYGMRCVCGIPRITITGTPDDWRRMRARIEVLETFDLGWWISRLRPILDEFIKTAEGHPNQEFWQAIYKPKRAYGATTVTGWLADLFPYLGDDSPRRKSHVFEYKRENWALPVEQGVTTRAPLMGEPGAHKGVAAEGFPSGVSSVPIELTFPDQSTNQLDLVAGYFAVEQSPDDLSLSPVISWAVAERPRDNTRPADSATEASLKSFSF